MISVIMPVYNSEKFLGLAIESILNQTFAKFEFIIINDGSSDLSEQIILSYANKDSRIRYFSQSNCGVVRSLNLAIELSSFEFIARMDSDDICLPDRFELQLKYLMENKDVGVIGGQTRLIDSNGIYLRKGIYPCSYEEILDLSRFGSPVAHPAVMFRRSIVIGCGLYRESFKHAEDYDLWLRVLEKSKISNLSNTVLLYREHLSNVSKVHSAQQQISTIAAKASASFRRKGKIDFDPDKVISVETLFNKLSLEEGFIEEKLFLGFSFLKEDLGNLTILEAQLRVSELAIFASSDKNSKMIYVHKIIELFKFEKKLLLRSLILGNIALACIIFPDSFFRRVYVGLSNRMKPLT